MAMGMCVPRASQWGVVGHGVSKKGCGGWVMRSSGGAADVGEAVEHDHLEHPHIVAPPHLLSLICLPARRIDPGRIGPDALNAMELGRWGECEWGGAGG